MKIQPSARLDFCILCDVEHLTLLHHRLNQADTLLQHAPDAARIPA
jgi:hypothetical protein